MFAQRGPQARSALKSRHSLSQAPEKGPEKSMSTVTSSQAPAQGPGLIVSLPSDSDLASANTITRLVGQDNNRELDSILVLQAPGSNVTPGHLTNPPRKSASPEGSFYSNGSVSPMETVTVHTHSVPRQYAIYRSNRSPSDSNQRSKRHRYRSRSLSSDERSSSSRGRSRHDKRKNRKSRLGPSQVWRAGSGHCSKSSKHLRNFRVGTLNVNTQKGRDSQVVETLSHRKVDLCCGQETRYRGGHCRISNSYTMGCPPVCGDNPRALASGLSYVQVDNPWYNYFIPPTSV